MSGASLLVAAFCALGAALNASVGAYGSAVFCSLLVVIHCTSEICTAIHRSKSR